MGKRAQNSLTTNIKKLKKQFQNGPIVFHGPIVFQNSKSAFFRCFSAFFGVPYEVKSCRARKVAKYEPKNAEIH